MSVSLVEKRSRR